MRRRSRNCTGTPIMAVNRRGRGGQFRPLASSRSCDHRSRYDRRRERVVSRDQVLEVQRRQPIACCKEEAPARRVGPAESSLTIHTGRATASATSTSSPMNQPRMARTICNALQPWRSPWTFPPPRRRVARRKRRVSLTMQPICNLLHALPEERKSPIEGRCAASDRERRLGVFPLILTCGSDGSLSMTSSTEIAAWPSITPRRLTAAILLA